MEATGMVYEKPEIIELGTLADLTDGVSNPVVDTTFAGSMAP
jgi:hypothetical protein